MLVLSAVLLFVLFVSGSSDPAPEPPREAFDLFGLIFTPCLIMASLLPWLLLLLEGRNAVKPEKANPPSWASAIIELDEQEIRFERKCKAGVSQLTHLDWKWATVRHTDEAWCVSAQRYSPLLIPRDWIQQAGDKRRLDEFFQALTKWQQEPGNLAVSEDIELPADLASQGHAFRINGQDEYALSERVAREIKQELPKFSFVSRNIQVCFYSWFLIALVGMGGCIAGWFLARPSFLVWCFSFSPGVLMSAFSWWVLWRMLKRSQARGVMTDDAIWIVYEGSKYRQPLNELPIRFRVQEALVLAADEGLASLVLSRESFEDPAVVPGICHRLGIAE